MDLNLIFRIHQLEKDLFYYKKTSRDLKKKLRELLSSNPVTPMPEDYNQGPGMIMVVKWEKSLIHPQNI